MNYNESMFKNVLIVVVAISLLISSYYWSSDTDLADVAKKTNNIKKEIHIKDAPLTVYVADEPHEQTQGLSDREYMAENEGMIFIFSESIVPTFWMKEMKFGLDIIWLDAKNTIIGIEKNVLPETFPKTFAPFYPVKYVLEVNAGWSDRNSIRVGDKMIEF